MSNAYGAPARPTLWDACGDIVVEDDVDRLVGRDFALDRVETANEFELAIPLHAAADHGAVEHAERGK